MKKWYAANKDVAKERNNRLRILREYGLTHEQYEAMFKMQSGVCAVCGRPPKVRKLDIEHDHKTGRVRCLACHQCNRLKIGTNTVETARRVLAILESDFDGRTL
jgi:hypothetical protein